MSYKTFEFPEDQPQSLESQEGGTTESECNPSLNLKNEKKMMLSQEEMDAKVSEMFSTLEDAWNLVKKRGGTDEDMSLQITKIIIEKLGQKIKNTKKKNKKKKKLNKL